MLWFALYYLFSWLMELFAVRRLTGEQFQLVNDHDPKPLFYQFSAERQGQFSWEYVEQGPQVWRVTIGRVS